MKAKVNVGTRNVCTTFEPSKAAHIANEIKRYHIEVLGIGESRWSGSGLSKLSTAESIIYSDIVTQTTTTSTLSSRVAIIMSPTAPKALMQWEPISSCRIMTARWIQLKGKEGHNHTMLHTLRYAPTSNADEEKKEEFYRQLQSTLDKTTTQLATSKF
ncbi:unnamed protein product [Heterobilharzia americana]|nr:unnamed protein product [Heterobilharzia americana]